MQLSKIYSSDSRFEPILFNKNSINAILATGERPHSVGKTTLFKLINYCLLNDETPSFLSQKVFESFIFFLEIELPSNKFLTIRRSVKGRGNTAIKIQNTSQDCLHTEDRDFDFVGGNEKALAFLNSKLEFSISSSQIANFRKYLGYFLRDKDDFSHAFMLNKYKKGKDVEWKTVVASLVGLDENAVRAKFNIEKEVEKLESEIKYLENNENCNSSEMEVVRATMAALNKELTEKEQLYREFDFYLKEHNVNKELVSEVEEVIAKYNIERYELDKKNQLITKSLIKEQEIDLKKVKKLFDEIDIKLNDMLVKSYTDVIEFNKKITKDREFYLTTEQARIQTRLVEIDDILKNNNSRRKEMLSILKDSDTFGKFKKIENEIVEIKNRIFATENFLKLLRSYRCRLTRVRILNKRRERLISKLDSCIRKPNETSIRIKNYFKDISKIVFGAEAILGFYLNKNGNLEFSTKVIDTKKVFENTKEEGEAFARMFCFIFDASLALTYRENSFFKFIAHDGLFDNLGYQYKDGLIEAISVLIQNNIQYIFTSIEDEIPANEFLDLCKSKYLVKELADTEQQRLFKMDTF